MPYDGIENQYIKSKRNSLIRFFDLNIPCNGLKLHLKEKDAIEVWSDTSNTVTFDCETLGVSENLFWIGDDASRGKYRLISTVSDRYEQVTERYWTENSESFDESHQVMSPVELEYNWLSARSSRVEGPKAMKFKTLLNAFNTNDIVGGDELSLSIYSDLVGDMFKCGTFKFNAGDVVDFDDLVVPCSELVTVTLTELDGYQNDGHTVLIPCTENSETTVDLLIPKGDVQGAVDTISNINSAIGILNWVNPFPVSHIFGSVATSVSGLAINTAQESNIDEIDALYNLKVEVVNATEGNFTTDERI